MKWFITYQMFIDGRPTILESVVIDIHPLLFMQQSRKQVGSFEMRVAILFAMPIDDKMVG